MKLKELITKAVRISLLPSIEWKAIHEENYTFRTLLYSYALPLILFSSIGRTIGMFFSLKPLVGYSLVMLKILSFNLVTWTILPYLLIYAGAYTLNVVLPRLGFEKNLITTTKLVVFTFTPLFIITFFVFVHPVLRMLIPVGVYIFIAYTLYILWYGVRDLLEVKENERLLIVFIITAVTYVLLFLIQKGFTLVMASFFPGMEAYFN
jgi:hypothetical protein